MSRILVIGDLHIPVVRPGYLQFCQDLYKQWRCDKVVFIGDLVDFHSISFHPKHPDCPGPKHEYEEAMAVVADWHEAFPKAKICIGNHDERVKRLAATVSIPEIFLRSYNEVWGAKGWDWQNNHVIDDIYFAHGHGMGGGVYPAANMVRTMLMSVAVGHFHSAFGVKWFANPTRRIFALDVGCGIDDKAKQFAYAQNNPRRSILGAAVIIDGIPYSEVMPCGRGERYHDSRFKG